MVVAFGKKSSNLYYLHASITTNLINAIENDGSSELWHRILSYISKKGLDYLAKNNMLLGLKGARLDRCAHYLAGK